MSKSIYSLGPDSVRQPGVPKGTVQKRRLKDSSIYPGSAHDFWVYVPDQYQDSDPACVMFFQDGEAYFHSEGEVRAPMVFDNLIHRREMPMCIGVFVNPASKEELFDQRAKEYVPLNDDYARFLLEEILAQLEKDFNLVADREGRAICGMSDGGLCAFNAAWHRSDAFSKVVSHIGSYTRLHGGSDYPYLIRETRGNPRPIRVFLQDGENDVNLVQGNWTLANIEMASALMYARYDYRFELGTGGHDLRHGGAIFPDTLRWLWRDYPGVVVHDPAGTSLDSVLGDWGLTVNFGGDERYSRLKIRKDASRLAAVLLDDLDGELEISEIDFEDEILRYEYATPPSQKSWGKGTSSVMSAWLKVSGESLEGALSMDEEIQMDLQLRGQRLQTD